MIKKIFTFVFLLCLLVSPLTVSAQFGAAVSKLDTAAKGTGLTKSFEGSISTVITGVLSLAGTIFLVLTVYAGILWMTAQMMQPRRKMRIPARMFLATTAKIVGFMQK